MSPDFDAPGAEPRAGAASSFMPASDRPAAPLAALAAVVCYNNGAAVSATLRAIPPAPERNYEVVVIDDGSTDDTPARIAAAGLPMVRHERNRGLGAAIKTAMRSAIEGGYDILCILAGNAKDDPREIPRLLEPLRSGQADYVQGSRFAAGGSAVNTPAFRYWMVKAHAIAFGWLTGRKCTDALNGFRAYRTALLRAPDIDVWQDWLDGYELETYLHFKVLRSRRPVVEIGVSKTYPSPRSGRRYTHIRPLRDWWRILRPLPLILLGIKR